LKKLTGSVWFWFYKHETEKTEPNPNRKKLEKNRAKLKKPSQTGLNRFLSSKTEPKPIGLNRFHFGFGLKKNFSLVIFFYKNRTEPNRK
jgi:hypothetical protein